MGTSYLKNQYVESHPYQIKRFGKTSSQISSGELPQSAEFKTPRLMDTAGECSVYDGFTVCLLVLAKRATLLHEVKSVRIMGTTH